MTNTPSKKAPQPYDLFLWLTSLALRNISHQTAGKDWSDDFVHLLHQKIRLVDVDPESWGLSSDQMDSLRQIGEAIQHRYMIDDWISDLEQRVNQTLH